MKKKKAAHTKTRNHHRLNSYLEFLLLFFINYFGHKKDAILFCFRRKNIKLYRTLFANDLRIKYNNRVVQRTQCTRIK